MENQLEDISKVLEDLAERQAQLDKKTKDAEEYRQLNNKLLHNQNMCFLVFGIIVIALIISSSVILQNVVNKYLDSNNTVTTTTTTDMTTGSDSVLLNDIHNSNLSGISN